MIAVEQIGPLRYLPDSSWLSRLAPSFSFFSWLKDDWRVGDSYGSWKS